MTYTAKKKILILDDDYSVRIGLKKFMESRGYEVYDAECTARAKEIVNKKMPDVVILDLIIHGSDGFEFYKFLKNKSSLNIKVVILTGYPTEENFLKSKVSGVDIFIAKPSENSEILHVVQDMLGKEKIIPNQLI